MLAVLVVAYILEHEEDDDDEEEEQKQKKEQEKEKEQEQEQEQRKVQEQEQRRVQPPLADDDIERACTSKDDGTEAETQTNPRYFPKSPKKITLDEILLGMQKIDYTITNTMRDFEQRLSRLEQIVLKMRNAWIHHRTCHLEGLEYDDEQED
nr:histone H3.v1-like [Zootoca vivipara]